MKTLKFSGLFALMIISLTSCNLIFIDSNPDHYRHELHLSFRSASGNDLVKGIGLWEWNPSNLPEEQAIFGSVKRDLHELDIIGSEPCKITQPRPWVIRDISPQTLSVMMNENGYYYLISDCSFPENDCPKQKKLTYKLKCSYVFGDEEVHELVTYWDIPKIRNGVSYATCNRIEFEGKIISPVVYQSSQNKYVNISYATIILEDREN